MRAVSAKPVKFNMDGTTEVQAVIIADNTPAALPTNGGDVDGMTEKQFFAPMSVLYVTADVTPKVYVANESGVFIPQ